MKIFISILFFVNFAFADFLNISLKDYITLVSRVNKINILLDKDLETSNFSFIVSKDLNQSDYLSSLNLLLANKNLVLEKQLEDFYIIKNPTIQKKENEIIAPILNTIIFKYLDIKDLDSFLGFYPNIKFNYIPFSKTLFILSSLEDFNYISSYISKIDILPKQLKLKITILDTNLKKLNEFGIENNINLSNSDSTNFFFNLVSAPYTVTNNIPNTQTSKFYSFVKLLNSSGTSNLVSSPILTLRDNKLINFNIAQNIPVPTATTVLNDDTSKTTTSINYKDVGLFIDITPSFIGDFVSLDLDLKLSSIVSNVNNQPVTSSKNIKQNFYIEKGVLFVLTGINQTSKEEILSGVPLLMDIPYLGWLFKSKSTTTNQNNLSIVFELVDDLEVNKTLDLNTTK
jgi:general secretion pathway protein D